jgi:hypothetical protein
VEISRPEGLNVQGDMTFMAWVKTTSDAARDRLIFGDVAGLAVHRNITIELDRGALHVGHGNDTVYESFSPSLVFDGGWKHLAIVFEKPHYYLYVDGSLHESGGLAEPISRTNGAGRSIGGWGPGYFKGAIDEVRLYSRALAEREILGHLPAAVLSADQGARISLTRRLRKDTLAFNALFTRLDASQGTRIECELTLQGEKEARRVFSAQLVATRPDSERAIADAEIATRNLVSGTYRLAATVRDSSNKVLALIEKEVTIAPSPHWLGSQAGVTDAVLPPYIPVQVKNNAGTPVVDVWGRTYRLGGMALPRQIVTRDKQVLAGPVRLRATVNGKEVSWSHQPPTIHQPSPGKVNVEQDGAGGAITARTLASIEYDGLLRAECTLSASAHVEIQSLVLEIPVKREHARYLYTWPTVWGGGGTSGELVRPMEFNFHPIVWLGDDARGLTWMCESENDFSPDDPSKVIQVLPEAETVTLRIRLLGKPATLLPDRAIQYVFALQPTPLKPMEKDGWESRFGSCPWYGDDYDLLTGREFLGKPALVTLRELGVRTLIVWNWTPALAYPWPLEQAVNFKSLVRACHAHGIRVIPYLGYQISEQAPEYSQVRDEVVVFPVAANADKYPQTKPQLVSSVCLGSVWQDSLVDHVSRMIDEFDIDGVYVDSANMPWPCTNALHGCTARRLDGTRVPVYPVFAVRDTFRRLYAVIKSKKADGVLDSHVFDCMNPGALAFSTSYWTGEQLSAADVPTDSVTLDRFRTEFMGVNWGVPCDMLAYKLGSFKKALAVSLPHDILTRFRQDEIPTNPGNSEAVLARSIWELADDFGRREAAFVPYYQPQRIIEGLPKHWIMSMYRHPRNGTLAIVSNLGRLETRATLRPDWKTLGLAGPGSVLDGVTRRPIPLTDGQLQVALPAGGWQYLWFQPVK